MGRPQMSHFGTAGPGVGPALRVGRGLIPAGALTPAVLLCVEADRSGSKLLLPHSGHFKALISTTAPHSQHRLLIFMIAQLTPCVPFSFEFRSAPETHHAAATRPTTAVHAFGRVVPGTGWHSRQISLASMIHQKTVPSRVGFRRIHRLHRSRTRTPSADSALTPAPADCRRPAANRRIYLRRYIPAATDTKLKISRFLSSAARFNDLAIESVQKAVPG